MAMNIDEACVTARGDMLATGTISFEGPEADRLLVVPDAMIAIRHLYGTEFTVVPNARREADGLWTHDWQVHSIRLEGPFHDLPRVLDSGFRLSETGTLPDRTSFDLHAEHGQVAWVALDTTYKGGQKSLLGQASRASIAVRRDAHGLDFTIVADLAAPKRGEKRAAPIRATINARLSFATMALAGSSLWRPTGESVDGNTRPLQTGPLAARLTLDDFGGTPLLRGDLALGPRYAEQSPGPWYRASFQKQRLFLEPRTLYGGEQGFVTAHSSLLLPQLVIEQLGSEQLKTLLSEDDETIVMERRGAGIGHVAGITGRDAGEYGPHKQPITSLQIRLSRSAAGLEMRLDGELGPIRQLTPSQPPLGPELRGVFHVPAPLLFARGWASGGMFDERKRLLAQATPGL